jgi:hypothetical protein
VALALKAKIFSKVGKKTESHCFGTAQIFGKNLAEDL